MHTLKLEVEQQQLNGLDFETLRDIFTTYHTGAMPAKSTDRAPPKGSWRESTRQFDNPNSQYMNIQVEEFTMAFANQLRKLMRASPKVDKIILNIDSLHKFELKSYHMPEEIYEELNF